MDTTTNPHKHHSALLSKEPLQNQLPPHFFQLTTLLDHCNPSDFPSIASLHSNPREPGASYIPVKSLLALY